MKVAFIDIFILLLVYTLSYYCVTEQLVRAVRSKLWICFRCAASRGLSCNETPHWTNVAVLSITIFGETSLGGTRNGYCTVVPLNPLQIWPAEASDVTNEVSAAMQLKPCPRGFLNNPPKGKNRAAVVPRGKPPPPNFAPNFLLRK